MEIKYVNAPWREALSLEWHNSGIRVPHRFLKDTYNCRMDIATGKLIFVDNESYIAFRLKYCV